MNVQFFSDMGDADLEHSMILLSSFTCREVQLFGKSIRDLIVGNNTQFSMHHFPFIYQQNCQLSFELTSEDKAIYEKGSGKYICGLTKNGYQEFYNYLLPFFEDISGFQFLINPIGGLINGIASLSVNFHTSICRGNLLSEEVRMAPVSLPKKETTTHV